MKRGKWVWVVALFVIALPVADAAAKGSSGGGGSRSSGGSSGGSKSSGSSGGSKSSGGKVAGGAAAGAGAIGAGAALKPSPGVSKPTSRQPSSGPKKQVNSAHLIPKSMRGVKVPPGRSFAADSRRVRTDRRLRDPYSRGYYGHTNSPFYYLWLASVLDDDGDDPLPPQQCRRYDADDGVCLDYYRVVKPKDDGGGCSSFVIWPWMFGAGGWMALRRRLRGAS